MRINIEVDEVQSALSSLRFHVTAVARRAARETCKQLVTKLVLGGRMAGKVAKLARRGAPAKAVASGAIAGFVADVIVDSVWDLSAVVTRRISRATFAKRLVTNVLSAAAGASVGIGASTLMVTWPPLAQTVGVAVLSFAAALIVQRLLERLLHRPVRTRALVAAR